MTACAFVHPKYYPTVITDLIVSDSAGLIVTPSNIGTKYHPFQGKRAKLARKSVCLDNPLIILGFAGDVAGIKQVISGLLLEIPNLLPERKSRQIGDKINAYITQTSLPVSSIGFSIGQPDDVINVLAGRENNAVDTKLFNTCFVTGSGGEWLKSKIAFADHQLVKTNVGGINYFEDLVGLLGYINSSACFDMDGQMNDSSFGGYFEAQIGVNYRESQRMGRWIHLGYQVLGNLDDLEITPLGKQVVYDARKRLVTTIVDFEDAKVFTDWPILSVTTADPIVKHDQLPDENARDNVTVFLQMIEIKKRLHFTLTQADMIHLKETAEATYDLEREFLRQLILEKVFGRPSP